MRGTAVITVLMLLMGVGAATGQEHEEGHHEIPHSALALFLGVGVETDRGHEDEEAFVLGLEYTYRFHQRWSVGALLEGLGDDTIRSNVVAVPLSFWTGRFRVYWGPGYEFTDKKDEFLMRFGLGYEFELGDGWVLAPEAYIDLIGSDTKTTYAGGLAIGKIF